MKDVNKIKRLLFQGNGMFSTSMAMKAGLHKQQLSTLVKAGILERASRGIYVNSDGLDDRLYWMQQRAKKIVYSHETALFLHRMTSRTPDSYSITVPSSYKASTALRNYCKIYYIKQSFFNLGTTKKPSGMGNTIITYNLERTLCDIIRSRNKIDGQIVIEAVKNYARFKNKDLNRLYKYAGKFGVKKILNQYLEVLL